MEDSVAYDQFIADNLPYYINPTHFPVYLQLMRPHKLEIYAQKNIKLIFILWRLLLYSCAMICKARERVKKRGETVGVRAARFGYGALARFMERDESPLSAAGNGARDIEPCRKFRATGNKERFYLRQLFFYRVYESA